MKVDVTAPTLTVAVAPNPVAVGGTTTVTPTASDALSGLAAAATCGAVNTATPGSRSVSCTATDNAGNIATASAPYVVAGGPTITATATKVGGGSYTAGTWSKVGVRVTFACTSVAALVGGCPAAQTLVADTAGTTVSGTATDVLGQSATAQLLVKIDGTAPTLNPTVTPNPVAKGATATATANATDATSGIASSSCLTPSTTTPGAASVQCTATDAAGNTATKAATYTVLPPPTPATCAGSADRKPLAPLNADGTSVFLRTSAVPLIFRACDMAGKSITTKGFVTSVTPVSNVVLPSSARVNELWYVPVSGFRYVALTRTWVGSMSTAGLAPGKKYTYRVSLSDGTSFTFTFGLK